MADQKDYAVIIAAQEQAELQEVEPDSRPLGSDEVAGHSIVTLISAGTELAGGSGTRPGRPGLRIRHANPTFCSHRGPAGQDPLAGQ